ncbi:aquaporin-11-like [Harpegnathos saltator]|uniref:aquaporin-11-like n=1 Tax=Harpegnathos saltator TaxID=610380 RepID=UPI00058B2D06|nr:aquaporin-11-like [Harpegnathos saltator]
MNETLTATFKYLGLIYCIIFPLIRKFTNLIENKKLKNIFKDMVATFELCAINYEIVVGAQVQASYYSELHFFILTCMTTLLWVEYWHEVRACPNEIVEHMFAAQKSVLFCISLIFAELLSSYVAFRFMTEIWNTFLPFKRTSVGCSKTFDKDLVLSAFICELLLTIASRLSIYCVIPLKRYIGDIKQEFLLIFVISLYRTIGFSLYASFNNPVLGACVRYGCPKIDLFQNVLVYWIAPICGSVYSMYILQWCRTFINYLRIRSCEQTPPPDNKFFALFDNDIPIDIFAHA